MNCDNNITIKVCDMHTCGQPLRIIESIDPPLQIEGKTLFERNLYFIKHYDYVRRMIINEPRGHYNMFGAMILQPLCNSNADVGVLFLHNGGWGNMNGDAIIGIGKYLVTKRLIKPKKPITKIEMECPCGIIKVMVEFDGINCGNVYFNSIPSFVSHFDKEITLRDGKKVFFDISFGGHFYVIVKEKDLGVDLENDEIQSILDKAMELKCAVGSTIPFRHPTKESLSYLNGIFIYKSTENKTLYKNLVVFDTNVYDRSPCGSGTIAWITSMFFRGNIFMGDWNIVENAILGHNSQFHALITSVNQVKYLDSTEILDTCTVQIKGKSHYVAERSLIYESKDSFKYGFRV